MIDGLVGRKLCREQAPLASAPQDVEDGIDHLAHIGRARATTAFGRGNERCQDGPFRLGEIRWVALRHPMPSTAGSKRANLTTQTTFQTGSKELEFRWVPEDVTRLATLLSGEVHIADVPRALQQVAVAKGMQVLTSQLPAIQHAWQFGGLYFASPDKLDPKVPFVK